MTRMAIWALALFCCSAQAHDMMLVENKDLGTWPQEQILTPEAGVRFACHNFEKQNPSCYCCHNSEIVRTKFRLIQGDGPYPEDGYEWLDPKTGKWARVPDYAIHWGETTPTKEAVIFILSGVVRCFFPGDTGG